MTSPPGARYIQLLGQDGQPSALLVAYGRKWSANILERWRQRPQESPKGTISAEIVDLFSRCIPAISASLSKGNLFQVIGTFTRNFTCAVPLHIHMQNPLYKRVHIMNYDLLADSDWL